MQKINKLEKFKLSSPKNCLKMKATEDSVEIHHIKSFGGRTNDMNHDKYPKYPSEPVKL